MARTKRNNRRSRKRSRKLRGGGSGSYGIPMQYYAPTALAPAGGSTSGPSTAQTGNWIRPPLVSTMRGGFVPSIMGQFVANAQAVVTPVTAYTAYRLYKGRSRHSRRRK